MLRVLSVASETSASLKSYMCVFVLEALAVFSHMCCPLEDENLCVPGLVHGGDFF